MVSSGILASLLVPLSPPDTPSPPPPLSPTHPLLSAQWKSLITGGESNPWQWMKDEGLPPSLSFSQSLSLSSFFPWMLVMLGRFSPSLPLIFPLPLSPSLSLSFLSFFFFTPLLPPFFPPQLSSSPCRWRLAGGSLLCSDWRQSGSAASLQEKFGEICLFVLWLRVYW